MKKILERLLQSLRVARAYAGGEVPQGKRMHYFAMNPADGKMVRKKVSYPRKRTRKRR